MEFEDYLEIISECVHREIEGDKYGFLTSVEKCTVLTVCDEILSYAAGISNLRNWAEAD